MKLKFVIYSFLCIAILFKISAAQNIINKQAPGFVLQDINGQNYSLSENLNKNIIILKFWTTYCAGCRQELKKLNKLYKKYEKDGLLVICIAVDGPKTVSKVKSLVKTNRLKFKVLLDTNNEVMHLYQVNAPPYTFLIDKKGNLSYNRAGYRNGDDKILEELILNMIKNKL